MHIWTQEPRWESKEQPQRISLRRYRRYKCGGPAELHVYPEGHKTLGSIVDLSLHGCCVQLSEPLRTGAFAHVEVLFRVRGDTLRMPGVIRHREQNLRAGIEFTGLSERKTEAILTVVRELWETQQQQGYIGPPQRAN